MNRSWPIKGPDQPSPYKQHQNFISLSIYFISTSLDEFAISTGLEVNYHKSNIYPINVPEEKFNN
jgi:hypothetical protein